MKILKVALLQLLPENALDKNLRKGMEYCRKAKDAGTDIALFPEMWSIGYEIPVSRVVRKKELSSTSGKQRTKNNLCC